MTSPSRSSGDDFTGPPRRSGGRDRRRAPAKGPRRDRAGASRSLPRGMKRPSRPPPAPGGLPPRSSARKPIPSAADRAGGERLQKVLAAAGIASRRECEELITSGRVEVDGQIVTELGVRVDPTGQRIRVDGVALPQPKRVYFALHKPPGVVCTNRDPSGRERVIDLIRSDQRLFSVGRLDQSSEGLILVTNDGELANRLTHPRYGVEKVYRARVVGHPTPPLLEKLKHGLHFAEGVAKVEDVRIRKRFKQGTELEIVLKEGRNREIRRLMARLGHKVLQLRRIAVGPIRLGELPRGAHRKLSPDEVEALRRHARESRAAARQRKFSARESVPPSPTRPGPRRSQPSEKLPAKSRSKFSAAGPPAVVENAPLRERFPKSHRPARPIIDLRDDPSTVAHPAATPVHPPAPPRVVRDEAAAQPPAGDLPRAGMVIDYDEPAEQPARQLPPRQKPPRAGGQRSANQRSASRATNRPPQGSGPPAWKKKAPRAGRSGRPPAPRRGKPKSRRRPQR